MILYIAALDGTDVTPPIEGRRFIGFGENKYGYGPVCVIDLKETPYVIEPHIIWFPWVGGKDRLRLAKWAFELWGKDKEVLAFVQKNQAAIFDHFTKKKVLRKIGIIEHLPIVEEIHMYQYERKRG